ncbi:DUF7263 family protein [Halopelagius longus]|uniref:Uncharacterized protein n=1 Tax=Halopelagius longus TaxID=1236180 RepID=A0A1H1DHP4_9EURY|nr:hypothetical protein [Halopelagius longus]RDI71336.1 hypothetical protein DWB78_06105 [Halopelagius longus]SDQ75957.1 hypothetical protein SAMN05216278_2419 [Halopelagius longus]
MNDADSPRSDARGQANLLALAAALVLLTAATVGSVALADRALGGADRDPGARHAAEAAAARLVAAESNYTRRANVVNRTAVRTLDADDIDRLAPPVRGRAVRVRLGNETLLERGDPEGATARRLVRVEGGDRRSESVNFTERTAVSLPDRVRRVRLGVSAGGNTSVVTVRANDRVVLHDRSGLSGEYVVSVPPVASPRLSFAVENGSDGTATVEWTATNATAETLEVTVGA